MGSNAHARTPYIILFEELLERAGIMGALRVVYHICATGPWEGIVRDQLTKLVFSGLYECLAAVHCCISGPEATRVPAVVTEYGSKVRVEHVDPEDDTYERMTLTRMRQWVEPDDRVLYIHTKGVTKPDSLCVYHWRFFMEYYLVHRWRECVSALDGGAHVVGVMFRARPHPHFSGNFWWCTGAHALRLPRDIGPGYTDPEMHVLSIPDTVVANVAGLEDVRDPYHQLNPPSISLKL